MSAPQKFIMIRRLVLGFLPTAPSPGPFRHGQFSGSFSLASSISRQAVHRPHGTFLACDKMEERHCNRRWGRNFITTYTQNYSRTDTLIAPAEKRLTKQDKTGNFAFCAHAGNGELSVGKRYSNKFKTTLTRTDTCQSWAMRKEWHHGWLPKLPNEKRRQAFFAN